MSPKHTRQVLQLKITLDDTHPPIWRRVLVSDQINLLELHNTIQVLFDWGNYHLHEFEISEVHYGDPQNDEMGMVGIRDETKIKLSTLHLTEGQHFQYVYDFGDSWDHTILVEKIRPMEEDEDLPKVIKGKRAAPPDDSGGVWGYESWLEALKDPNDEEHNQAVEWLGEDFDPEAFNLDKINRHLKGEYEPGELLDEDDEFEEDLFEDDFVDEDENPLLEEQDMKDIFNQIPFLADFLSAPDRAFDAKAWTALVNDENEQIAGVLPIRQNVVLFLNYLKENNVAGIKTSGNLPVKAVREILHKMDVPPDFGSIEDYAKTIKSEDDAIPVLYIHLMADTAGFIEGGRGELWKVTREGEEFLRSPATVQVGWLFTSWMREMPSTLTAPVQSADARLVDHLSRLIIEMVEEMPLGEPIPFEPFADRIIKEANWPTEVNQVKLKPEELRTLVLALVVAPLAQFHIIELTQSKSAEIDSAPPTVETLTKTPFGSAILQMFSEQEF